MMSSSNSSFTPKALVPIKVVGQHVHLYPIIDETMEVHERAYAHHVNKTNLSLLDTSPRQVMTAFGHQIGQSTAIEGEMTDFLRRFSDQWSDLQRLTVVSIHDSVGEVIGDTSVAGTIATLLPIQNGAITACRRADIRFLYVRSNIDFSDKIDNVALARYETEYFIELPQTTHAMLNGANNPYTLTTFGGPDDLNAYTPADVIVHITSGTLQQYAARLVAPTFGAQRATLDTRSARRAIEDGILSLAMPSMFKTSFISTAPNYTTQPHAAIELIHQVHIGADGKPITRKIQQYHSLINQACHPFSNDSVYPVNVCSKFMQNMDPMLQPIFRRLYPNHSVIVPLDSNTQRKALQLMLQAAQQAEVDRESIISISQQQIQTQAFMFHASRGATTAFPSQAKRTLAQDTPSGASGRKVYGCHGCGDLGHGWSTRKDGIYTTVCPNKDKPGVEANALKNIAEMRARMKDRNKDKRRGRNGDRKRKSSGGSSATSYASLTDDDKRKVIEDYASSLKPSSTSSGAQAGGPQVFCVDVIQHAAQAFNSTVTKKMMPIAINSNLPHIQL